MFFRFLFEQLPFFLFLQTSFLPSPFSLLVSLLWFVFAFFFFKNFGFSSPFFLFPFFSLISSFFFFEHRSFLVPFFLPSGYKLFLISSSFFLNFFGRFLHLQFFCFFQLLEPKKKTFVFETSHHFLRCL